MRAEVVTGYSQENRNKDEEFAHEYPLCIIEVFAEPENGGENRVATYVEVKGFDDRESRLFVERSSPSMDWLEKVFDLIRETESRGIVSGGLHEIRIDCENEIEVREDTQVLIDHCEDKVYFDDGSAGDTMSLETWIEQK